MPHDADWTYSLVFPPGHEWHSLRAEESYRRVHEWIQSAFTELKTKTELAPCGKKSAPGQCFAGYEKFDLLWEGRKIAGAAQRRNKLGLLIQGSVQPPPISLAQANWEQAMREAGRETFGIAWSDFAPDALLQVRTASLTAMKYSQSEFIKKR